MSASIVVKAVAGKNSLEFKKHLKAVQFCLEHGLSFPKETSEFFKGRVDGGNLEDYTKEAVLKYIEDGVGVDMKVTDESGYKIRIKTSDIPKEVDEIIVTLHY